MARNACVSPASSAPRPGQQFVAAPRMALPHAPCRRRWSGAAASATATAGASPERAERVSTTFRAPIAIWKSCAARPMRRSGGSRSMPVFISRDMKRSASGLRGHTPSLSPPTTSVSTLCSRASSAPQMAMRRSAPCAGLTVSGAISAAITSGHSPAAKSKRRRRRDQAAQEVRRAFRRRRRHRGRPGCRPLPRPSVFQRDDGRPRQRRRDLRRAASRKASQRRQRRDEAARALLAHARCRAPSGARARRAALLAAKADEPHLEEFAERRDVGPAGAAAQRHQFDDLRRVTHARALEAERSSGCLSSASRPTGSPGRNTASQQQLAAGWPAACRPAACRRNRRRRRRSAAARPRRAAPASRSPVTSAARCAGLLDGAPRARWRSPPPRRARWRPRPA